MEKSRLCHIEGSVDSVVYKNEENGFAVLTLDVGGEPVTVVGEIGNVDEGEELRLTGEYIVHPKFGEQFKASLCERALPKTASAIQRYLASGVIKGIGPVMAKNIVKKFGDEALDIMENEPERLLEVEGLSEKKCEKIIEEIKSVFGIRTLMIFIAEFSISASYGVRAWKKWGIKAIDFIKANPYILCTMDIGLPFSKAEEIAFELGISDDNENRIKAGISCVLIENSYAGHICLPRNKLTPLASGLLKLSEEKIEEMIDSEISNFELSVYEKRGREFIYLPEYFSAEDYVSRRLGVMRQMLFNNNIDFSEVIDIAEEQNGIKYEELQREAINTALSCGFMVLTGGPGTGKTTTLNAIISLFEQQGMRVKICAPTGRAAKRISDLTGYDAKTIHRLLEVSFSNGDEVSFKHNEENLLDCDVLIVDEMSMVDTKLFSSLLKAISLDCKLIMVGDSDQLPSVGAGNLLKDIIDSKKVPVVALKKIFRQASQSMIVTNAHKIVNGEMPDLLRKDGDFFFFQRLDFDSVSDLTVDLIKRRLPEAYGYSPIDDIQILSPTRKGPAGTVELNKRLQNELNPPSRLKSEVKTFLYTYRVGDKVMQTKNNYDIDWEKDGEEGKGIFNGDIGIITDANKYLEYVMIDFEGRICKYNMAMLENLELAYAITVHKSQGSEFDVVVMPVIGGYDKLYYRSLLYTAVTRAKKMLILVGSSNRLAFMVDNNRRTLRYSCLKDMLVNGDEE